MKIQHIKINNFGKLSNKEIKLNDGINIIYGENESGKSTLLKFIISMFYGLHKTKNGKIISDYEKYTPWRGEDFSGRIEYKLDNGKKYEVFRDFKKKNPNIFNEQLEDISKTFHIDKTLGNQFIIDQTKVDEELFTSTTLSLQEEVKLNEKEQNILIQKMSNLASTGEENVSFQETIAKLNKKQMEEIGTSRSQGRPINIVTKKMEEIQNKKEEYQQYTTKQYVIEEEKRRLEEEIKQEENKLELIKKLQQKLEKQELEKQKISIKEDTIKEYNNKVDNLKKQHKEVEQEADKKAKKENKKLSNRLLITAIICVLFIIMGIISLVAIKNKVLTVLSFVIAIVSTIYIVYKNKSVKVSQEKNTTQTDSYQNEIDILISTIQNLKEQIRVKKEELDNNYKQEKERIRNEYIGIIPIKIIDEILQKESIQGELKFVQNKLNEDKLKLHTVISDKKEITQKIESLLELEEEYINLEEEYEELIKNSEMIDLVKEEIEKAYETMKQEITPQFTNNLSKIIEKISSGKYKNIRLEEEKGMIVEVENGNYLPVRYLSVGTIDQLYLSLRLGAGIGISEEKLPILLDETFAYWDDARLKNILQYLSNEFNNRQIILFTCTKREKEMLTKLGIEYNFIEM